MPRPVPGTTGPCLSIPAFFPDWPVAAKTAQHRCDIHCIHQLGLDRALVRGHFQPVLVPEGSIACKRSAFCELALRSAQLPRIHPALHLQRERLVGVTADVVLAIADSEVDLERGTEITCASALHAAVHERERVAGRTGRTQPDDLVDARPDGLEDLGIDPAPGLFVGGQACRCRQYCVIKRGAGGRSGRRGRWLDVVTCTEHHQCAECRCQQCHGASQHPPALRPCIPASLHSLTTTR